MQLNHNTYVILIIGLHNILTIMTPAIPSHQEGIRGLKTAQTHCSLHNSSASCPVFILYVGLSKVYYLHTAWLTEGDIHSLLMKSGRNFYTTSCSTQMT